MKLEKGNQRGKGDRKEDKEKKRVGEREQGEEEKKMREFGEQGRDKRE